MKSPISPVSIVLVTQSCLTLYDPMDCSNQASLSMEFSRQEYWSGLPFPSPGDLPDPGIEPRSPTLWERSLHRLFTNWATRKHNPLRSLDIAPSATPSQQSTNPPSNLPTHPATQVLEMAVLETMSRHCANSRNFWNQDPGLNLALPPTRWITLGKTLNPSELPNLPKDRTFVTGTAV